MKRFTSISEINPIKRALTSLKIQTKQRLSHIKHLRFISKQQILYNEASDSGKYSDQLSYCYRLFDFNTPNALHHFSFYSDKYIGGQSRGELLFDKQQECLVINGTIDDTRKGLLTNFPSVGMARTHPYSMKCGPFNALSIQIEGDGHPVHLGVEVYSNISGLVQCYGIIASKIKGWQTYQIPFSNMILVGSEQHQQWNNGHQQLISTTKDGTRLGFDRLDMRRIINTQVKEITVHDINLRLLGSKMMSRKVGIRNINLVRRSHSQAFIQDYLHPYFYIVDKDPYIIQKDIGISWLAKGYQHFRAIDLGDKKYIRKDKQGSRSKI